MESKKCESCLSIDFNGNNGKNTTCKITGSVIVDVNRRNYDCPLDKEFYFYNHIEGSQKNGRQNR